MADKIVAHTPGPWTASGINVEGDSLILANPSYPAIACAFSQAGNAEANARLIAAAPDLLDKAIGAADWLDSLIREHNTPSRAAMLNARDILRAAIAKAEGK